MSRVELDRFTRMCRGLGINSSNLRECEEEASTFFTEEIRSKDSGYTVKVASRHNGAQVEYTLFNLELHKLTCGTSSTERYRIIASIRQKIWDYEQAEYEKLGDPT